MTSIRVRGLVAASAILAGAFAPAPPALAQPIPAAIDPASVPDQPWYPPGYRDLRIAAAGEVATFPREPIKVKQGAEYNLASCGERHPDRIFDDPVANEQARLALEVSRLRAELKGLGYPAEVYEQPLLDYERARLTAGTTGSIESLAAELEARRQRTQAGKPIVYQPCSPPRAGATGFGALLVPVRMRERGDEDVAIVTSPPNGRLWLINGFAFRLCERKTANPWDHLACGWNEYTASDGAHLSGRYIYEVRWPDGTVRRGARILEFDSDDQNRVIRFTRD